MPKVKLVKSLSYSGIVSATVNRPFVDVDDDDLAAVLATGYFAVVDGAASSIPLGKTPEELAAEKLAAEKADLAARAEKLSLNFSGDDLTVEQVREIVERAEARAAAIATETKELGKKSRDEVDAVATGLGIDISAAKNKDEVIALIIAKNFPTGDASGAQA